jgi:2-dehydro-3-deoxy-D-arabinonate dehydratase
MRYYQRRDGAEQRLLAERAGDAYDLTAAAPGLATLRDLLRTAANADRSPDEVAARHLDAAPPVLEADVGPALADPVTADEVWACGVTYKISEEARTEESDTPEMYLDVYDAERPEVFFKATPSRTVGPGDHVGIRADSDWDVPEPELGVVLYRGDVVGYTLGNDMSSRSIEGQNPLYLPQAKTYDKCCAIGPSVVTDLADPHSLDLSMTISRDDNERYHGETNTGEMVRTCEELVDWWRGHNAVPELAVLLTGTSLVPADDFTLQPGDRIDISLDEVGTLTNHVVTV